MINYALLLIPTSKFVLAMNVRLRCWLLIDRCFVNNVGDHKVWGSANEVDFGNLDIWFKHLGMHDQPFRHEHLPRTALRRPRNWQCRAHTLPRVPLTKFAEVSVNAVSAAESFGNRFSLSWSDFVKTEKPNKLTRLPGFSVRLGRKD